jgi:formate dehydrogenase beta subunit
VALAIGQAMDTSLFWGWDKTEQLLEQGLIKVERGTGRTPVPKIYAGGDAAFGAALFITAIRQGQEAARAIDEDLRNIKPYREYVGEFTTISPTRDKQYLRTKWALPALQPAKQRKSNVTIVENNYTKEEVKEQSNRCLQCHVSPAFDGNACIKCNGCIDVCPTNCLKLVSLADMHLSDEMKAAVRNFYGKDPDSLSEEELAELGSAIIKDEDLCIRCGLCAEKCPTQAVTMDVMNYSYRWIDR